MDSINPTDLLALAHNPTFILLILWLGKEVYANSKKRTANLESKLSDLTIAITRLETKLESLEGFIEVIPKLKADVDASHQKLRELASNA